MKTLIALLIFANISFVANAHDGNDGWVTIQNFKLWSNTFGTYTIRVQVTDGYYNPAQSCADPDSYMVASELPDSSKNRLFSMLLAANFASKPLRVYFDSSSCERNRPKIMNAVAG